MAGEMTKRLNGQELLLSVEDESQGDAELAGQFVGALALLKGCQTDLAFGGRRVPPPRTDY
jgi:hypothetical protein